jgi:hypothetical protein
MRVKDEGIYLNSHHFAKVIPLAIFPFTTDRVRTRRMIGASEAISAQNFHITSSEFSRHLLRILMSPSKQF